MKSDDVMALVAVGILKNYMTDNMEDCGEGWWKHKDGDEFSIAVSDFYDVMMDLEKFLRKRVREGKGELNEQH